MKSTDYVMDPLIRWIVEQSPKCRYNMSLSGLPEVNFQDFGIDATYHQDDGDRNTAMKELRETLSNLYKIPEKNLIITSGGSESIFLLGKYFIDRNFRIIAGKPEYPPLFTVPESIGSAVIRVPHTDVMESLNKHGKDTVLFMSNPNNPLSTYRDRNSMMEWIPSGPEKPWVYTDEAFLEFRMQNRPESLFSEDRNIVINGSMTKFYGFSNLRVGWIAGPEHLIRQLNILRSITGSQNPSYPMWIAKQCLENRVKFQKRAKDRIGGNLPILRNFLTKHRELEMEADPGYTSYCFIKYSYGMDSEKFCSELMKKKGVLLSPGTYFGVDGRFRLCLTQEREEFSESMDELASFLENL